MDLIRVSKSMGKWSALIAFVLVLLATAFACYFFSLLSHGELASKDDYAYLQNIEFQYRHSKPFDQPLLLHSARPDRDVLGLPTGDEKFPRSWLLLNETIDGKVLMVPEKMNVHVSCRFVGNLAIPDDRVRRFLREICLGDKGRNRRPE